MYRKNVQNTQKECTEYAHRMHIECTDRMHRIHIKKKKKKKR